jgi:hypothetical protein
VVKEILKHSDKKGRLLLTPYTDKDFKKIGIEKDVEIKNEKRDHSIAWSHRKYGDIDIYFISNQTNEAQAFHVNFRVKEKSLQTWDPVTGKINELQLGRGNGSYFIGMAPGESNFFIFRKPVPGNANNGGSKYSEESLLLKHPY